MSGYLADTSALNRIARSDVVAQRLGSVRRAGSLWTCAIVTLELGYSARNRAEWDAVIANQRGVHDAPVTPDVCQRALEVQGALAARGHHRVALPDLLVAAAAEAAGVTVLHYDHDYDVVASQTGQPVEWIAPSGSID